MLLPTINGSAVDFGLFNIELNREASGYSDGVKGDNRPLAADDQIDVNEEDEIDKENYSDLCDYTKFPPASESDPWLPNDSGVVPHVFNNKERQDMLNKPQTEIEIIVDC